MIFIATHYAALLLFVLACWGLGRLIFVRLGALSRRDVWLEGAISTTLGLGVFICVFQGLGMAGVFRAGWVLLLVGLGAVVGLAQVPASWREMRVRAVGHEYARSEYLALAVVALIALPTLLMPLAPPRAWDEVMYHLPYARQVAQNGALRIYDWLRYPWFPYNYNLLYAAALMVYDDVFPHLLHALAGWLSMGMVYRLGVSHVSRLAACLGAGIWLSQGDYISAYIDGAVTLFVLSACVCLWWWRESLLESSPSGAAMVRAPGVSWLVLAAFFLGLAAGSKYQALTFLPLAGIFAVRYERRVGVWGMALIAFLLPCVYWYARSAIHTGDPFHPIGGRLFGFTDWNLGDYQRQIADVKSHARFLRPVYWPMLVVPFTAAWRHSAAVRAAVVFCAYALLVWVLSSRYPRYLMAAYPLMALMAAVGWLQLYTWCVVPLRARWAARVPARGTPLRVSGILLLILLGGASLYKTLRYAADVSPTPQAREAFLRTRVTGYETLSYLRAHPVPGRLYLAELSDAVYYAPSPAWGDAFGPWRYDDFLPLPPEQLAQKLRAQGFGAIVVHTGRVPNFEARPGFDQHFEPLYDKADVKAYRVRPMAPP